MKIFLDGMNYKEFLELAKEEEEKENIKTFYEDRKLKSENVAFLNNLKDEINILAFGELYCKDAAIVVPILNEIAKLNSKIKVKYLKREGNEELLEELSGERRIPTIIKVDNKGKVVAKYIEFPKEFKEELTDENREFMIKEKFRKGIYDREVEREILELIMR